MLGERCHPVERVAKKWVDAKFTRVCGAGGGCCSRLTKGDVCHPSDFIVNDKGGKPVPAELTSQGQ